MSSTRFDVVVFDFDGTLVQSAAAKRQAFFAIFPPASAPAVEQVLARNPDGSRHDVIPAMIAEAGLDAVDAPSLIGDYGRQASGAVGDAPEMPGASELLRRVSKEAAIYVASATPHDELLGQLSKRGWLALLKGAYGFPHRKTDVVAALLKRHAIPASRLLVVGDGISDREAAERNGCPFHEITGPHSLMSLDLSDA